MPDSVQLPLCDWDVARADAVPPCDGVPAPVLRLLRDRGLADVGDPSAVTAFLDAPIGILSPPDSFPEVGDAAKAILETIDCGGQIVVFGDFDCDGITATAILTALLSGLGANVFPFIPERSEGYGLTDAAVERCLQGARSATPDAPLRLLVTVDCGMGAAEGLSHFISNGYSVVVSDHHTPGGALPDECVVVSNFNPAVPPSCRHLCGAGLAYTIAWAAIARRHPLPDRTLRAELHSWMGPLAIATVADMVPLVGANRAYVREGLNVLNRRPSTGIKALIRKAFSSTPRSITAYHLGFVLGPHINAAGRMAGASTALSLLLADNDDTALENATSLASLNSQRKQAEESLLADIEVQLKDSSVFDPSSDAAAVFAGRDWPSGVVGLAAGRLCERFGRPTVVLSVGGDGIAQGIAHGSARAPEGACNLYRALEACSRFLSRFGGHTSAAGLTLAESDLPAFRKAFAAECLRQTGCLRVRSELKVSAPLSAEEVSGELIAALHRLEPFGNGNEPPLWMFGGVKVATDIIGREKTHLRLRLTREDGLDLGAIWFGGARFAKTFAECERWDVVGELSENEYRQETTIQLLVRDARPHGP